MINRNLFTTAVCLLTLLAVAGCGPRRDSTDKQTYLLKVEHPGQSSAEPVEACFNIRMARVAPAFSGSHLIYRTGPVTYEQDYYHSYLSAPSEQLNEIVSRWFRDSPQFVCSASTQTQEQPLTLESHLDELYTDFENPTNVQGVVHMHFYLSRYDKECGCPVELLKKTYTARTPISHEKPGAEELVEAMSQSLSQVLLEAENDIAALLRSDR